VLIFHHANLSPPGLDSSWRRAASFGLEPIESIWKDSDGLVVALGSPAKDQCKKQFLFVLRDFKTTLQLENKVEL
jgi:hypothetical protein